MGVGISIPGDPQPESRFTWPTDLCPHPEYWTSTDGDSTECEVSEMVAGLVRGLQPEYCVETGSAWGQTTWAIGKALKQNGHGWLDTLEPDPERADSTRYRCTGLPVRVYEQESLSWKPPQIIDFAFFDSHYELRVPEFEQYVSMMRLGTIVCFHDSAPGHGAHRIGSGRDLQNEIAAELSTWIRFVHFPTPRGITIGEVF